MKNLLSEDDYSEAARIIDCETAIIKAVAEVESSGKGFFDNDEPKILFEAHIFSKLTKHKYDASHPDISSRKWNKALYKRGIAEYDRLNKAKELDNEAALKSASWGKFQIMGFNHEYCGYDNVDKFTEDMKISEREHLLAFIGFVKAFKLDKYLKSKNWAKFAEGYNGKDYKKNNYDNKLRDSYKKFSNPNVS